ncbi:MAG: T9SS type A sorting domain-containing protein [Bacteroidetes bacterium]|nr:T9SS type A sorting domain-containing protein [Bacteroidota bacterium]MBK9672762.1 T9SS type A sorting domain-containing protein [Bacteroidota bacterium]MBP6412021.1 T9SS type A sorting domain-containing protein [Bacteroidia bacterium]
MNCFILRILLIFFFLNLTIVSAQGIVNKWVIGYPGGGSNVLIEFNRDSILSIDTLHLKMSFRDLNASICDSHGDLLFYTNGGWIANSTHDTMMNGNNLVPGTYATNWKHDGFRIPQGAVIVPFPDDSSKYYLFHETADLIGNTVIPCKNLFYSVIDMNLDIGLGAVTLKNIVLLNDTLSYGALTVCKHANGRDWWLLCHQAHSDLFFEYLVTPAGILGPYTQNIGSIINEGGAGQACFSPDGKKYARYFPDDDLDIYDFDRCTGLLSNSVHISIYDSSFAGGISFSLNSRYVYISSQDYIYQFDVNDTNISSTKDTVAIYDGFSSPFPPFNSYFYLTQLAPDGRIYISAPNSMDYLHVIDSPDSGGNACNVIQHGIYLKTYNGTAIPNHPNYFLRADSGSVCDTLMLSDSPIKNSQILKDKKISVFYDGQKAFVNAIGLHGKTYTLQVIDVLGHLVIEHKGAVNGSYATYDVPCTGFASGIYFVSVITDQEQLDCKFVKE